MSFGDTFWKVWEVRTSIRIQEYIENSLNSKPKFDNTVEIVNSLVRNQQTWNQKIAQSRQNAEKIVRTIDCEFCNNKFPLYAKSGNSNQFSGFIYFEDTAYRTNESVILNVTSRLQQDNLFRPLFFCSKKCALDDRAVNITDFQ